jgi:hypothetical protein
MQCDVLLLIVIVITIAIPADFNTCLALSGKSKEERREESRRSVRKE